MRLNRSTPGAASSDASTSYGVPVPSATVRLPSRSSAQSGA